MGALDPRPPGPPAGPKPFVRRRFQFAVLALLAANLVLLLAAGPILKITGLPQPLKYLAAAAPAAPMVGVIVALGLYLTAETDEFRRMQLVQAMLWGIGLTLTVTTVWGFVETLPGTPHMPLTWVFPIFCVGMASAQLLIRRRYR